MCLRRINVALTTSTRPTYSVGQDEIAHMKSLMGHDKHDKHEKKPDRELGVHRHLRQTSTIHDNSPVSFVTCLVACTAAQYYSFVSKCCQFAAFKVSC